MPLANTLPNGVVESSNSDPASLGGFAYASSVRQTYKVADQAALNLLADMETGDLAFRRDNLSYSYWSGTAWRIWYTTLPVTFTPVWTGFTLGNGTLDYARYTVAGAQTTAEVSVTLGSTSSVAASGGVFLAYPTGTTFLPMADRQPIGTSWLFRNGGTSFHGVTSHRTDGRVFIEYLRASNPTDANNPPIWSVGISATGPIPFATGDKILARWTWLS